MSSERNFIAKYKHVISFSIAAIILAAIFVPFQLASAFTLTTTLPDSSGNTITQSVTGNDFQTVITVANGELISLSSITVMLDNTQSGVKIADFSPAGVFTTGDMTLIKDNVLTISASTSATSGYYGYGYGQISSGLSYAPPYQYSFGGYTQDFIAGNNYGYTNYVTSANTVNGYIGPATITISGKLNTALMTATHHTLDVVVNTGAGGNGVDQLVAPQISFTVNENASITTTTVTAGTNVSLPPITVSGSSTPITITISNVQSGGTVAAEIKSASSLQTDTPGIFSAVGSSTSIFNVGTSTGNSVGVIFDIDLSSVTLGAGATIDVTIPYNPAALPAGFDEANVKFFHWNGSTWEDKTRSVDTAANTVTGRLTSLSPVVAGFTVSSPTPSTSGGGGGGGGSSGGSGSLGGSGAIDLTTTYSDGYFATNPLAKVQLHNSAFVNANGINVFGAKSGEQVTISSSFKNYQQSTQNYAIIIQIIDSDGFTTDIGWSTGQLEAGQTGQASRSWTTEESGSYTVKMFVWNGVGQAPTPLSEVTTKNFVVT